MIFNSIFFLALMFTTIYLAYVVIRSAEDAAIAALTKAVEKEGE